MSWILECYHEEKLMAVDDYLYEPINQFPAFLYQTPCMMARPGCLDFENMILIILLLVHLRRRHRYHARRLYCELVFDRRPQLGEFCNYAREVR